MTEPIDTAPGTGKTYLNLMRLFFPIDWPDRWGRCINCGAELEQARAVHVVIEGRDFLQCESCDG